MPAADCKNRVLILIAPGFEEAPAIYCLARLREACLSASLVGLAAGQVFSWHGLTVCPDLTLDQVEDWEALKLVVIPGGRQCATMLLTDPRVHRVLARVMAQEGRVGVMGTAVPVVTQSGLLPPSLDGHYVLQSGEELEAFVSELVCLMMA